MRLRVVRAGANGVLPGDVVPVPKNYVGRVPPNYLGGAGPGWWVWRMPDDNPFGPGAFSMVDNGAMALSESRRRMAACPEYLVLAFRSGLVNEIEVP